MAASDDISTQKSSVRPASTWSSTSSPWTLDLNCASLSAVVACTTSRNVSMPMAPAPWITPCNSPKRASVSASTRSMAARSNTSAPITSTSAPISSSAMISAIRALVRSLESWSASQRAHDSRSGRAVRPTSTSLAWTVRARWRAMTSPMPPNPPVSR